MSVKPNGYPEVKVEIYRSGRRQYDVARARKMSPSKLSAIINGAYEPSSLEKEDLAEELKTTVEALFNPDQKAAV